MVMSSLGPLRGLLAGKVFWLRASAGHRSILPTGGFSILNLADIY